MSDQLALTQNEAKLIYTLYREAGYQVGQPIPESDSYITNAILKQLANRGLLEKVVDTEDPFAPSYALTIQALDAFDTWVETAPISQLAGAGLLKTINPSDAPAINAVPAFDTWYNFVQSDHRAADQQKIRELQTLLIAVGNRAANYQAALKEVCKIIETSSPSLQGGGQGVGKARDILEEIYLLCEHHLDLVDAILESCPLPNENSPLPFREGVGG